MGCGEATTYAVRAFSRHGLSRRWKFALGNSLHDYGSCDFNTKTIEVSRVFLRHASRNEARDTILHEIAHAVAGTHLHDARWKSIAKRIGARPKAQPDSYERQKTVAALAMARARKKSRRRVRRLS
jgi:predicted SprT family Zn-dependent metalloprotease